MTHSLLITTANHARRTIAHMTVCLTVLAAVVAPLALHAQAPAPKGQSAAATAQPAADSAPPRTSTALPGRQSWVSDRHDFQLGDLVTILVDEYTLTSLDKEVDATDNRRRDMNLGITTSTSNTSYGLGTGSNNSSTTRGSDSRTNRLTTMMAARVVEIGPNGLMRLEGTKTLNVEKSKINLSLSGWVRNQDIASDNSVQSSRMADAKLDYQAEGPLGSPKGGIIGRILGKFWP